MTKKPQPSSEASPSAGTSATSSRKPRKRSRSRSASAKTTTRTVTPTPSPRAAFSPSITFIVPTVGRPTLGPLMDQLRAELGPLDQVVVVADGRVLAARGCTNGDPRMEYHEFPGGRRGNPGRDFGMSRARGDWLMFVDDDDLLAPGAVSELRKVLASGPRVPHIFRCAGLDLPKPPFSETTPGVTFVVPNDGKAGCWDFVQSDDTERWFLRTTLENYPEGPVLYDLVVYHIRPHTPMGQLHLMNERQRPHAVR